MAVPELSRLVDGELDDLLGARRERDLARRGGRVAAADDELDRRADLGKLDTERVEDASRHALALADETQQEVLRSYVVVVETDRLVLGEREYALGAVVKAV